MYGLGKKLSFFRYEQHDDFEAKCICKRYGRGRCSNSGAILYNIQDWLVLLFYLFFMIFYHISDNGLFQSIMSLDTVFQTIKNF